MSRPLFPVCLLLALAAVTLTACQEEVQEAPLAGDTVHVPAFEWRVRDTRTLVDNYTIDSGMTLADGQKIEGFTGLDPRGTVVVYTKAPRYVDDQVACTLGHEVMHLALGDYHQ